MEPKRIVSVAGVALLGVVAIWPTGRAAPPLEDEAVVAGEIDGLFEGAWAEAGVAPAGDVEDGVFYRRVAIDLHGTIPSLPEIRAFNDEPADGRRERLIARLVADERFADRISEELKTWFVGDEPREGLDARFRERRFRVWLQDQVEAGVGYDEMVRQMIASSGLPTDVPSVNYIAGNHADPERLASRTAVTLLGLQIGCAQCHDHPFADWSQEEFRGTAAFFGRVRRGMSRTFPGQVGIHDWPADQIARDEDAEPDAESEPDAEPEADAAPEVPPTELAGAVDDETLPREMNVEELEEMFEEEREELVEEIDFATHPPLVPFEVENLPVALAAETPRAAFAEWLVASERFPRAAVSRVWRYLMHRGLVEPFDDLDGGEFADPALEKILDHLAADFVAHGYDVRRLVRVICLTRVYRMSSIPADGAELDEADEVYAVYRPSPLRGRTMAFALIQATSASTLDANGSIISRIQRYGLWDEMVKRFGDPAETDAEIRDTIPRVLSVMNMKVLDDDSEGRLRTDLFGVAGRIDRLTTSDEAAVEAIVLMTQSRRPTDLERELYVEYLGDAVARAEAAPEETPGPTPEPDDDGETDDDEEDATPPGTPRARAIADIFWAELNSTEFQTQH